MLNSILSVIIINYNGGRLLKDCIYSIYREATAIPFDIWVVDNDSQDNSIEIIKQHYPHVNIIENRTNIGFAKANNMVLSTSTTDYFLLLNPDTIICSQAIEKVVSYMDQRTEVGIAGCKVLNEDGSIQLACRRSIPTPKVAFFRLTGMSKLFPNSKLMAKYNLTYLDAGEPHEVGAVSGAFLMIRGKVIDKIGGLDSDFFMYGEELDWCLRTKKAGWAVMYYPYAQIIHYKGECSKSNSRKATFEFYRSMRLFHKKHFADNHSSIINAIIYVGIFLKSLTSWRSFIFSGKVGSKR